LEGNIQGFEKNGDEDYLDVYEVTKNYLQTDSLEQVQFDNSITHSARQDSENVSMVPTFNRKSLNKKDLYG